MIVSTKAISSPGRTEKLLQPPLMLRFLRSNVGSKSGRSSRSRASPMLFRSKKNTVIETNQEPSSPKVSCIGQVRVRRSNPTGQSKRTRSNRHCWWFRRALLFSHKKFSRPRSLRRLRHIGRKWVLFFRFGYCKKVDIREEFLESNSNQENQERAQEVEEFEDDGEEFVTISPPKNAFFLTRCRSAPYRSSSSACKFEEDEVKKKKEEDEEEEEAEEEEERESVAPISAPSHPSSSSRVDDDNEENDSRGKFGIPNGRNSEGGGSVSGRAEEGGGGGPLIVLTRCKSEPARTGEKLISITQNKVGFC